MPQSIEVKKYFDFELHFILHDSCSCSPPLLRHNILESNSKPDAEEEKDLCIQSMSQSNHVRYDREKVVLGRHVQPEINLVSRQHVQLHAMLQVLLL